MKYDVIMYVAGIAHIKVTNENADLYYKVNRDLAYEIAKKAKDDGVKQFIFLSSMSVFEIESGVIYDNSPLKPNFMENLSFIFILVMQQKLLIVIPVTLATQPLNFRRFIL